MNYDYDLLVIGAGAGGLSVAAGAAQLGVKTALVEADKLGGDCLHYGCVPSKTFIHAAKLAHMANNAQEYGIQTEVKIDFSKVIERVQKVIASISRHDAESRFSAMGVHVIRGYARFSDPHTIHVDGRSITSKTFVIATGSQPQIPNVTGLQNTGYITNVDVFSLKKQPKSLIIIGGGPIACELGQSFQRLGTQVVMLVRSSLLSREDKDISAAMQSIMEQEGVKILTNTKLIKVSQSGSKKTVHLEENGKPVQVKAEEILVATGRTVNLSSLQLEKAYVAYTNQGLTVDRRLRTSQKHIYGCGDVIGHHLFTHAASYEAGIIIRNAVFHLPAKVNYTQFPSVTYTDPEVAHVGMTENEAKEAHQPFAVLKHNFANVDRAETEGTTAGFTKVLHHKGKILGVSIIGPHAGELLPEYQIALKNKLGLRGVSGITHSYPTLVESNKKVADQYFSTLLFSRRTKKWLKWLFKYRG